MNRESIAERVDRIASGFQAAQVLFAANRLGVFEAVARGAATVEELARSLGASARGVRILCDALVALGLLDRSQGLHRLPPGAEEVLLPAGRRSKTSMLLHRARQYERWAGLAQSVTSGAAVPEEHLDPDLAAGAAAFTRAMDDVGRESAGLLFERLDLAGVRTFLDVGGGPGAYALELCRRLPEARATVLDRAEVLEVTRERVAAARLGDRVELLPGDAFTTDLGGPWDLALLSNLLHVFGPEDGRRLVRRVAAALAPGGRLAIKEFVISEERDRPVGAALFAANMLVATDDGDVYTAETLAGWLSAAGLQPERPRALTGQSAVLVGHRAR